MRADGAHNATAHRVRPRVGTAEAEAGELESFRFVSERGASRASQTGEAHLRRLGRWD